MAARYLSHPLHTFVPRKDTVGVDEQTAFTEEEYDGIQCVVAGNGSGKTYCAAYKLARFLAETEPPDRYTPFWILSKNMEQATGNCWAQNLATFLTDEYIQDIRWHNKTQGLPKSIILKPKNGKSFVLEFKSYDMSQDRLMGANIIGFWTDESCPWPILVELIARCRKWKGPRIYTLTPLSPDVDLEKAYNDKKDGWKFYRFNTVKALEAGHVDPNYVRHIEENEMEELIETRLSGAFASWAGLIFKNFSLNIHVIDPIDIPRTFIRMRGIDFGWSHETACVWAARDPNNKKYYITQEYYKDQGSLEQHVLAINEGWEYSNPCYGATYTDWQAAQMRHEFAIRGIPNLPADKWVLPGIGRMQALFRQKRLFIFKNCEKLIEQVRIYAWDPKKMDQPIKKNDDLVDSLRYICYSDRAELQPTGVNFERPRFAKPHKF